MPPHRRCYHECMHSDDTAPGVNSVLERLLSAKDPLLAQALTRLGWPPSAVLGVDSATVEQLAREIGRNHALARALWSEGFRETRLLAIRLAQPAEADAAMLDDWVHQVQHNELAAYLTEHLLVKASAARSRAPSWSTAQQPLVRAIGYELLTRLNLDDEELSPDARFPGYFTLSGLSDQNVGAPANAWVRGWRSVIRYLGRRNRRAGQKAVRRAHEALLMWEQDKVERAQAGRRRPGG